MRRERGRGGDGVRWVDKEMGGLGMWKAQRMETGRQLRTKTGRRRGRDGKGAEDETEKAAKDEDG